jgi:zona occludens toxin (predicted ATPase)
MKKRIKLGLAAISLSAFFGPQAFSATQLTLQTDRTQLLTISEEPGTIVIGNPSIADVTVNGKQLFLHGHAFGDTNLIILDKAGNQIANFDITVAFNTANAMTMYKAGQRYSYTCAPLCEVTLQVGDPVEYTNKLLSAFQGKSGFATGKTSTEAAAPQAPQ